MCALINVPWMPLCASLRRLEVFKELTPSHTFSSHLLTPSQTFSHLTPSLRRLKVFKELTLAYEVLCEEALGCDIEDVTEDIYEVVVDRAPIYNMLSPHYMNTHI